MEWFHGSPQNLDACSSIVLAVMFALDLLLGGRGARIRSRTRSRTEIGLYREGYTRPANSELTGIVESSKPAEVKSHALVYLGLIADDAGKFNLAIDFFDRALKLNSGNFHAHYNKAIALRHKGMYQEALVELDAAQKLRPDFGDTRILKGQIQYQSNDLEGADDKP